MLSIFLSAELFGYYITAQFVPTSRISNYYYIFGAFMIIMGFLDIFVFVF